MNRRTLPARHEKRRAYIVEVSCPACGGKPVTFKDMRFASRRDAENYARVVEAKGYEAEIRIGG